MFFLRGRRSGASPTADGPTEAFFRALLIPVGVVALPLVLVILYARATTAGLMRADAMDFAQLGRNLSEGHGFVTYFLRPLALTHGHSPVRQPELTHGPLFPFILALFFGARGVSDSVAMQASGLFYLLTIPAVFTLGKRLFNPPVGRYAALLYTVNALWLDYAVSGWHITLCAFLATCLLLAFHSVARQGQSASGRAARGAGVAFGLCAGALYLTEPVFFWMIPAALILAARSNPEFRVRAAVTVGIAAGCLCLPWMIRNALLGANPIFGLRAMDIWGHTTQYPENAVYRASANGLLPGQAMLNAAARKMLMNLSLTFDALPQVAASWILAFFLPSLLFRFRNEATHKVRNGMLACLLTLYFGMLPMNLEMPLLASFAPTMLIFAVAYLLHLIQQANLERPAIALVAAVAGCAALFPIVRNMALSDRPTPPAGIEEAAAFERLADKREIVMTDAPWLVAWRGARPAVWLPLEDADAAAVRKGFPGTRWLFLTEESRRYSAKWQYVYDGFAAWNAQALEAKRQRLPPPQGIAISGATSVLMESLAGFESVGSGGGFRAECDRGCAEIGKRFDPRITTNLSRRDTKRGRDKTIQL